MEAAAKVKDWKSLLKFFGEQNRGRVARMAVFEGEPGAMTDYWIEAGLPLMGIEIDDRGENPTVEIMLGGPTQKEGGDGGAGSRHFTHTVRNARCFALRISVSGEGEGIDVEDAEGRTNVLRFED